MKNFVLIFFLFPIFGVVNAQITQLDFDQLIKEADFCGEVEFIYQDTNSCFVKSLKDQHIYQVFVDTIMANLSKPLFIVAKLNFDFYKNSYPIAIFGNRKGQEIIFSKKQQIINDSLVLITSQIAKERKPNKRYTQGTLKLSKTYFKEVSPFEFWSEESKKVNELFYPSKQKHEFKLFHHQNHYFNDSIYVYKEEISKKETKLTIHFHDYTANILFKG